MKNNRGLTLIRLIIIIVSIFFHNLIKNNDDFAPYECKEYDKDYNLCTDVYDLLEIKSELTDISQEYEKGLKLTFIQYDIKENSKTAIFQFYKDDYNGKNKACLLTMNIDIDKNEMTKIKYEKGNRKRVTGYSNEINSLEKSSYFFKEFIIIFLFLSIITLLLIVIMLSKNELKLLDDSYKYKFDVITNGYAVKVNKTTNSKLTNF